MKFMNLSARSESIRTLISAFHMYENDFARRKLERKKPKWFGNATSDNKYFFATRLCNLKRGQPFLHASVSFTLKEIMITSELSTFVTRQHRVSLHYYSFELPSKKQKKRRKKKKRKKDQANNSRDNRVFWSAESTKSAYLSNEISVHFFARARHANGFWPKRSKAGWIQFPWMKRYAFYGCHVCSGKVLIDRQLYFKLSMCERVYTCTYTYSTRTIDTYI